MKRSIDLALGVISLLFIAFLWVAGPVVLVLSGFLFVFGAFLWVPILIAVIAFFTVRALAVDLWVRFRHPGHTLYYHSEGD